MGWTRFLRRRFWDRERRLELEAYLDQEIDDNLARGMSRAEAERAAHRKLGNVTRIREDIYEMNTLTFLESAWQDLRYGARLLWRNPTFAVVAILTLALGTGANAAIFQLVDAVRLRTLPVKDPQQLVAVVIDPTTASERTGSFQGRWPMLTNAIWERIRDEQQVFSSIMAWTNVTFDLAPGGEMRMAEGLLVSGSFFDTLGVKAERGRVFAPADDVKGCASPSVVVSHAFWQREYAGDPSVLDRTILLNGNRLPIVGVSQEGFFGIDVGRSFDVAVPLCADVFFRGANSPMNRPIGWFLASFGRLKPGMTIEQAKTALRTMSPPIFHDTLPATYMANDAKAYLGFVLTALDAGTGVSTLRRQYGAPLWVLLGVTALVLLITCANLANLMLARATARAHEVSVRMAIGASRRRLVRQMLSESLLLAVLGAACGLLMARWLSAFLVTLLTNNRGPLFLQLDLDWRIFLFTTAVAALACLLFGLTPALRATSAPAATMLSARGATDARERFTLRRMLVVAQVALSLVLLVGAILMVRSLVNLLTLDPGFRHDGIVVAALDIRRANVPVPQYRAVFDSIITRLKSIPGVDEVAEVAIAPMSGSAWNDRIVVDGKVQEEYSNFNSVGPGYFKLLGSRIIAGREFTDRDTASSPRVAVVNEIFVKRYLAGQNPLGRVFHLDEAPGTKPGPRYQIIGVVAPAKVRTLREPLSPIAYIAALQQEADEPGLDVLLHSRIGTGITPAVAQALKEINPSISVRFQLMDDMVKSSLTGERLMAMLSGFFGGLAVLIAVIGLYGVMSYIVMRRRMEIGIRMALGADRSTVIRMVVRDAARLLAAGLTIGTILSVVGARGASALLYGLQPWDPITLLLGVGGLGLIALLASWWPARRAAQVAPTIALREG
jgi:putative ABC transport system permease protein